jgi:hypothetical protein
MAYTNHPESHINASLVQVHIFWYFEKVPHQMERFLFPPTMTKIMQRRKTNLKSILSDPITVGSCLRRLQLSVRNLKIVQKTTDKD